MIPEPTSLQAMRSSHSYAVSSLQQQGPYSLSSLRSSDPLAGAALSRCKSPHASLQMIQKTQKAGTVLHCSRGVSLAVGSVQPGRTPNIRIVCAPLGCFSGMTFLRSDRGSHYPQSAVSSLDLSLPCCALSQRGGKLSSSSSSSWSWRVWMLSPALTLWAQHESLRGGGGARRDPEADIRERPIGDGEESY